MYLHKASLFLCGVTMLLTQSASFKLNTIDSMSSTTPYIDECQSSNSTISCCQTISVYKFSQIVCVNVSSVDTQNVLPFTLSINRTLYIKDTYSDSKPQPYCVEYDYQAPVHLCAMFYNTTFTETQAHCYHCERRGYGEVCHRQNCVEAEKELQCLLSPV